MNDKENLAATNDASVEPQIQPSEERVAHSRRRLFRQGASVVAVTLASRPVLAWHCRSPSAWGSEQINPNTSLKTNDGHTTLYPDETWTISNWVSNTARNNFGQPWVKLKQKFPSLIDPSTKNNRGVFDYTKVSVKKLFDTVTGLGRPTGLSDTATVKYILSNGTDLQKYTIVAQLNYVLLAPLSSPNDLDKCVTLLDLRQMASGSYSPPNMVNVTWGAQDIVDYLFNNWIARPY